MVLTISDIQVHYEVVGNGSKGETYPPVLLLHGWGGTYQSLAAIAHNLRETNTCYLIDLPGFGKTSNPPLTWGIDEYTLFLKSFVDAAGLSTPIFVVGHSFGGALALSLAAKFPDLISKLVVCAPSWHRNSKPHASPRQLSRILHKYPLVRKILYKILFPRSDILQKPQLEENFKRIVNQDLTDVVQSIHQKTLILWGREDTYVPYTDGELLHEYMKQSILSVFPGMRHDLPIKHSATILPSINTFLTTQASS